MRLKDWLSIGIPREGLYQIQMSGKHPGKLSAETWEAETLNIFSRVKTVLQKTEPLWCVSLDQESMEKNSITENKQTLQICECEYCLFSFL